MSTAGGKVDLTERLVAALDGNEPSAPSTRLPTVDRLTARLSGSTVLPPRQRCTQALRAWFVDQLGPGFRFDAALRDYIAQGGHTLDEAVAHWRASRTALQTEIGAQFELNRFSRAWHAEHPGSGHADMLRAWRDHRSLPRDPP